MTTMNPDVQPREHTDHEHVRSLSTKASARSAIGHPFHQRSSPTPSSSITSGGHEGSEEGYDGSFSGNSDSDTEDVSVVQKQEAEAGDDHQETNYECGRNYEVSELVQSDRNENGDEATKRIGLSQIMDNDRRYLANDSSSSSNLPSFGSSYETGSGGDSRHQGRQMIHFNLNKKETAPLLYRNRIRAASSPTASSLSNGNISGGSSGGDHEVKVLKYSNDKSNRNDSTSLSSSDEHGHSSSSSSFRMDDFHHPFLSNFVSNAKGIATSAHVSDKALSDISATQKQSLWKTSMQVIKRGCYSSPKQQTLSESQFQNQGNDVFSTTNKTRACHDKCHNHFDQEQETHPLYRLSYDVMAHVLMFVGSPLQIHAILIYPLSRNWRATYTKSRDLWRTLCVSEPFGAILGDSLENSNGNRTELRSNTKKMHADEAVQASPNQDFMDSNSSSCSSYSGSSDEGGDKYESSSDYGHQRRRPTRSDLKRAYGRYRLLYASFVRCAQYLQKIEADAKLSQLKNRGQYVSTLPIFTTPTPASNNSTLLSAISGNSLSQSDNHSSSNSKRSAQDVNSKQNKKPKFAPSKITAALFSNSKRTGQLGHINLPWTCAIYSTVNWMVAFSTVRGIQTMCLRVLPYLLEDDGQRTVGQKSGLTDVILRSMLLYRDNAELHAAALHSIVLLARPLGGREGQPYDNRAMNYSGIFCDNSLGVNSSLTRSNQIEVERGNRHRLNGIAVVLDSMRRFADNESIQAMGCWSMVNIALIPRQKTMLLRLGGISVALNAMANHPLSAEVQFRAIFALINLVVSCESLSIVFLIIIAMGNLIFSLLFSGNASWERFTK